MSRDGLEQLLKAADDAMGSAPSGRVDTAKRVRGMVARRRRVRASVGVAFMLGVVGVGLVMRGTPGKFEVAGKPRVSMRDSEEGRTGAAELAGIRREIAARERVVEVMLAEERVGRAEAKLVVGQSVARESQERAAARVLWQAGRAEEAGMGREAEAAYADVVRYFPDTVSAGEAKRKLESNRKDG